VHLFGCTAVTTLAVDMHAKKNAKHASTVQVAGLCVCTVFWTMFSSWIVAGWRPGRPGSREPCPTSKRRQSTVPPPLSLPLAGRIYWKAFSPPPGGTSSSAAATGTTPGNQANAGPRVSSSNSTTLPGISGNIGTRSSMILIELDTFAWNANSTTRMSISVPRPTPTSPLRKDCTSVWSSWPSRTNHCHSNRIGFAMSLPPNNTLQDGMQTLLLRRPILGNSQLFFTGCSPTVQVEKQPSKRCHVTRPSRRLPTRQGCPIQRQTARATPLPVPHPRGPATRGN